MCATCWTVTSVHATCALWLSGPFLSESLWSCNLKFQGHSSLSLTWDWHTAVNRGSYRLTQLLLLQTSPEACFSALGTLCSWKWGLGSRDALCNNRGDYPTLTLTCCPCIIVHTDHTPFPVWTQCTARYIDGWIGNWHVPHLLPFMASFVIHTKHLPWKSYICTFCIECLMK